MKVCEIIIIAFLSCLVLLTSAESPCKCDNTMAGNSITVSPVLSCPDNGDSNSSTPGKDSAVVEQKLANHEERISALEERTGGASPSKQNCTGKNKGAFRFANNEDILQVCDGVQWQTVLTTGSLQKRGTSRLNAASSCQEIYATGQKRSGVYWINPDPTFYRPLQVFCEMQFNGGGWMRVYNMMAKPAGAQYAQSMYESITRNGPVKVVLSTETSHSIHTQGLRLEQYREVVYGWAKSSEDVVSHYGHYTKTSGIKGDCYVDSFCGNGKAIATMTSSVTGSKRAYVVPSNPTYPHVGVAWANYQVVWGYDKDTATYGNWGNWQDTSCCLAAAGKEMQDAGMNWRYSILIR